MWVSVLWKTRNLLLLLLWIDEAKANIKPIYEFVCLLYMNVGVMKDYKLRDLRASHTGQTLFPVSDKVMQIPKWKSLNSLLDQLPREKVKKNETFRMAIFVLL